MGKQNLQLTLIKRQEEKLNNICDDIIKQTNNNEIRGNFQQIKPLIIDHFDKYSPQIKIKLNLVITKYLTFLSQTDITFDDIKILSTFLQKKIINDANKELTTNLIHEYEKLASAEIYKELTGILEKTFYADKNSSYLPVYNDFITAIENKWLFSSNILFNDLAQFPINTNMVTDANELKIHFQRELLIRAINANYLTSEFKKLLTLYEIKLDKLSVYSQRVTKNSDGTTRPIGPKALSKISADLIPAIINLWEKHPKNAKELLKFFVDNGMPCQENTSYNHALIQALGIDGQKVNLDFIRALLELNAVDINTVIKPEDDISCKIVKTPFSVAMGKTDANLIKLLLEYGADPYLANKIAFNKLKKDHPDLEHGNIKVIISSGLNYNLTDQQEQEKWALEVDQIVEQYYLEKLSQNTEPSTHQNNDQTLKQDDSTEALSQEPNLIEKYITYKENAQFVHHLPEETKLKHKFDSLLLKWIQEGKEEYLENIANLIEQNSDLGGYSISYLLEHNISDKLAEETLSYRPALLHKFYNLKKQSLQEKINIEIPSKLQLDKNIFTVKGDFANKIYIKIDETLLESLPKNQQKTLTALEDMKFIKTDSKHISGIKNYFSCIKLKIPGYDKNLYTDQRFLDQNGNVLIIFDKLEQHSRMQYNSKQPTKTIYKDFISLLCPDYATANSLTNHAHSQEGPEAPMIGEALNCDFEQHE